MRGSRITRAVPYFRVHTTRDECLPVDPEINVVSPSFSLKIPLLLLPPLTHWQPRRGAQLTNTRQGPRTALQLPPIADPPRRASAYRAYLDTF